MDQEIKTMLAGKSYSEKNCAMAYAMSCLLTGPVPFQCPEYDIFPSYEGELK